MKKFVVLYNYDFANLPEGVERRSQDAVLGVADSVEKALLARGAEVRRLAVGADPFAFAAELRERRPDLVFNLCESVGGDARGEMLVPGILDLLEVPYTGSGPLALGLALQKSKSKDLLRGHGVTTPLSALVEKLEDLESVCVPLPAIVKPAHEDASIGIHRSSVVSDHESLRRACQFVLEHHAQPALVEQYIDGRELNVALLGNPPQVLPIAEIDFTRLEPSHPRIVTYAAKWDEASPEYKATPSVACKLEPEIAQRVAKAAREAFLALDCRDYGRVDIRLSSDGIPYVIEVNPNCDLSLDAGYARASGRAGLSYEELVWRLVGVAKERVA